LRRWAMTAIFFIARLYPDIRIYYQYEVCR
jgi:hypothetical protein